ncbi:Na+/H+ antiporter [Cronobacter dublinensis]|uniref:Na(+)/H(+) exchanger protein, CPA1 family n=1 Tax=Cronobacter dublinensis 1210 TaxID=1208656 RepID=A0ABP1W4N7_9ENTR|nr:Na+/H+ antiporter [Cronobacter dublinensis]EGT5711620.1 Na+/H+ antiporter [Cronobacter dublinensis subsp. dublinensis]CCJ79886.1 putative Na(+)/H(+) exchanger protein, CPA1 family precursor [Cronobacter dublinensis 1210]ALB68323.1 sodium:proton antiporter [Cronobacter dublinensis subsp. dublinensis LMG 23823]EGT4379757.1 Na+/H+ antiporter [Cronobacter dublinensis]EGT5736133.1 Na+/H+ antiporter [Cronobacter dublinensis subsp. dublinensis]
MEIFFTILIMTLMVSLSGVVTRMLPFQIPLPLMQIAIGALLAWPTFGLHVDFNPELFLVLFIPPLLFADGWKTPTREFLDHGREIIGLALALVVITVVGIGFLIYWMVPGIPLIPAFALAAVLSPTDAVALSGIVGEGRIPKKIMGILQGEALMNDASGLVSLKFAVAVAMGTMVFTVGGASLEFLKVAIGGLLAGIAVSWLYGRSLRLLSRWGGDEPATQIVLLFLLPFASYLIAEHIGFSGILAAVAAGMTITRSGVMRTAPLAMRLRANSVWSMLEFVFNGMVFLMLGLQLPGIMETSLAAAELDPNVETWMLFMDIVLIYAALISVRFLWLWIMKRFSLRFLKKKPLTFGAYTTRELLVASFAGVRGAITLAGVLSIPLLLPDGSPFPARYELVFLAAGVILFSLFVGVVLLPILLQQVETPDHGLAHKEERMARAVTAEVAITAIQKMEERLAANTEENIDDQLLKEVSARVVGNLRRRADGRNDVENSELEENLERRFRLTALRAERGELYHLRATRQISNETLQKMLHDMDLLEALLMERK